MAGNSNNTAQWAGADVFISRTPAIAGPTDLVSPWPAGWDIVGLLDGEEGFTEKREDETSERFAWGGVLVRRSKSKHKRTIRFVALEDNRTTFGLVNPGSVRTSLNGTRRSTVKVPSAGDRFSIGFETRDGSRVKRRIVQAAEVQEVAEIKESETEPTVYDITVVIFPDADGVLYTDIETDPEGTVTPAWKATTAYALNATVALSGGAILQATTAGTSAASAPAAPAINATVTDGTVTWKRIA
ncbi:MULTISPECIES: phage tail tube protein [unclassified Microbacterium]|uniref:phage tail tube protein n=1 Tax=unclassified Microbacterium TaxID=2609290 RepID=UPI003015918F